MSSYRVVRGDTFALVSRKVFGEESRAGQIARANPGAAEPLVVGTVLTVPQRPAPPPERPEAGLALLIGGERFRFWTSVSVRLSLDQFSVVEFRAPFDPDDADQRARFRPFSYTDIVVLVDGAPVFGGHMVGVLPISTPFERTVAVTGYSAPAVLNDCTAPASLYPIEYNGVDLETIANDLAAVFGLTVVFPTDAGTPFARVRCEHGVPVLSFLAGLARQRNLLVSDTARGELLFSRAADGSAQPVAVLQEGSSPLLSVTPAFHPQRYFSHVTGLAPATVDRPGSQYTVKNPHLEDTLRPYAFRVPDSIDADIPGAARNALSRMFGDLVAYTLAVDTWRDPAGALWAPGTVVRLHAPGAMVYRPYNVLIRHVDFEDRPGARTATLTVVLPGAFGGRIPEGLPWD